MNSRSDVEQTDLSRAIQSDEMDWDAYAKHYDDMCQFNPAYQDNIVALLTRIESWDLPDQPIICDIGAGTGNYILNLAQALPNASFVHVDFDRRMIDSAARKYREEGITRVDLVHRPVDELEFPESAFDVLLCVNALYAFPNRAKVLADMRRWLKPTGTLFIIDFGRKQRTLDWTFYIFREAIKAGRFGEALKAFFSSQEILKQNRKSTRGQETGRYWLHSTVEFGEQLTQSGFKVEELSSCYRDYADMAICRK